MDWKERIWHRVARDVAAAAVAAAAAATAVVVAPEEEKVPVEASDTGTWARKLCKLLSCKLLSLTACESGLSELELVGVCPPDRSTLRTLLVRPPLAEGGATVGVCWEDTICRREPTLLVVL